MSHTALSRPSWKGAPPVISNGLLRIVSAMLNICLPFSLKVDLRYIALNPVTRFAPAASPPSKASSASAAQHQCCPICPPHPLGSLTTFLHHFPRKSSGKTKEPLFIASNASSADRWAKHTACLLLAWLTQTFPHPAFFWPSPTVPVLSVLVPVPSWSPAPSAQHPPLSYGPFKENKTKRL